MSSPTPCIRRGRWSIPRCSTARAERPRILPTMGPFRHLSPPAARPASGVAATVAPSSGTASGASGSAGGEALRRELEELRGQLVQMRGELQDLSAQQQRLQEDVRSLKDALGG